MTAKDTGLVGGELRINKIRTYYNNRSPFPDLWYRGVRRSVIHKKKKTSVIMVEVKNSPSFSSLILPGFGPKFVERNPTGALEAFKHFTKCMFGQKKLFVMARWGSKRCT